MNWIKANAWSIGLGVAVFIIFLTFKSCSSPPTVNVQDSAPGMGWLFLKLAFAGLIWGAIISRERPYLAMTLCLLAVINFLVLLGKFDNVFTWIIVGFPFFAGLGIFGWTKTTGRIQSFLGFASGVLILFWMYLLYLDFQNMIDIGFLKVLFPDDDAKIIFTAALAAFIFATWKKSKFFYGISFFFLLCLLGNATINKTFDRFPERLTPPKEIPEGISELLKSAGKALKSFSHEINRSNTSSATKNIYDSNHASESYQKKSYSAPLAERAIYQTEPSDRPSREPVFVDWVRKGPNGIPTEISGYEFPPGEYYINPPDRRAIVYIQTPSGRIEGRPLINGRTFFTREGERPFSILAGSDVSLYRWKAN